MPIVRIQEDGIGRPVLVCVNHADPTHLDAPSEETTMRQGHGAMWCGLRRVDPAGDSVIAERNTSFVVRCFYCLICGYVEMYNGEIIEPETWGRAVR